MDYQSDFLDNLAAYLQDFSAERDWHDLQTPKNLAMALVAEAGELAAEFQWMSGQESEPTHLSPRQRQAIESEMADVLIYLVQLAARLGTSLPDAVEQKMKLNTKRFPPGSQGAT